MKKIVFALLGTAFLAGLYSFSPVKSVKEVVTYSVDASKSRVDWVGSKKNDFHTGYFTVKSGSVKVDGGEKLAVHLKSADFFDVAKFSEATYTITSVNYSNESTATINGTLNLKGAALPVSFTAAIRSADEKGFFAEAFFSLDRTLFGVNYGIGNVAKDVQIAVHLYGKK